MSLLDSKKMVSEATKIIEGIWLSTPLDQLIIFIIQTIQTSAKRSAKRRIWWEPKKLTGIMSWSRWINPPKGLVTKVIPTPEMTTIAAAIIWKKSLEIGLKFFKASSKRPIAKSKSMAKMMPKICLSRGTKKRIEKKIAKKIGRPPALGTTLFWMWAG